MPFVSRQAGIYLFFTNSVLRGDRAAFPHGYALAPDGKPLIDHFVLLHVKSESNIRRIFPRILELLRFRQMTIICRSTHTDVSSDLLWRISLQYKCFDTTDGTICSSLYPVSASSPSVPPVRSPRILTRSFPLIPAMFTAYDSVQLLGFGLLSSLTLICGLT